jgi:hypothetical protein
MAAVTVFVDDAVQGRFPHLCAKTGVPADGMLTIHTPVRGQAGLGVWWLLVLAGLAGWLGLLIISLMHNSGGEMLTVQVPWSEAAQHDHDEGAKVRGKLWLVALALVGIGIVFGAAARGSGLGGEMAMVLGGAAAIVALIAIGSGLVANQRGVDVRLDASRRWVMLGNVHDDFARAVEVGRAGRHPAAP